MSSILEALKKLEEEKAARRGGAGNLTGKVAKSGRRPRPLPAWLIPASMLGIAAVSVLLTWFAMNGVFSRRGERLPGKMAPETAAVQDSPLTPTGVPVTEPLKPHQVRQPMEKNVEATARSSAVAAGKGHPLRSGPSARGGRETASAPGPTPAVGTGTPLPALNVSGIVWQKDSAFRMAVVNGVPVREGGTVEGATVREILSDRVRFTLNGKDLEVPLEK